MLRDVPFIWKYARSTESLSDIRLNPSSYAVMALLKASGESTPYELKALLEKSVENFWPIPHTTFYAEPARLAQGGYLSERQEQTGRRRKLYALTGKGSDALDEWAASPAGPPQLRDEGALKIFAGADPVAILEDRRDWHRVKLAELESYLALTDPAGGISGPRGALIAGITYHRVLLAAVEEFLTAAPASS
jgi:DNA-binding PadR family transcriptional regulator